ncbi:hypothetical protein OW763_05780 [Clostridium aestuarii]|uniref:DUF5655 domain-containing protein n=1 Tax=Clostridium aestuarii TaxID=338193 RepID=A0ABT4CXZ3_9CLOT|nr:hypothetical protein [Clostridium aestuarii]MCY6483858.1 hypothetical protein [Clostridium aestuarii]
MSSNIVKENKSISADKSKDYYFEDYAEKIISQIGSILGNSFKPKYNKTGVTYNGHKGKILKVVKKRKHLEVEFNVPVTNLPGLIILNEKERIEKKMGKCQWIYKGDDISTVLKLVEEAAEKY